MYQINTFNNDQLYIPSFKVVLDSLRVFFERGPVHDSKGTHE